MNQLVVVQGLLWTCLLAGCIGYERERHGRAAGLRTHILVGLGACLVMQTAEHLMVSLADRVAIDPSRMGAQVISGIGFLGAGTILRFRASVRGLTTAASLWAVAGVGLAVGSGFLSGAVAATGIILLCLFGLARVERVIRKDWYRTLIVETRGDAATLAKIRQVLSEYDAEIRDLEIKHSEHADLSTLEIDVKLPSNHYEDAIREDLVRLRGTKRAHWA